MKGLELISSEIKSNTSPEQIPKPTYELKHLQDYLLTGLTSPDEVLRSQLILNLRRNLMDVNVPEWEKILIHDVWWLTMIKDPEFEKELSVLIDLYTDFRKEFHMIKAKKTIKQILGKPDWNYHESFKNILLNVSKVSDQTYDDLSQKLEKILIINDLNHKMEEKVALYQVLNATSTFNDVAWKLLMRLINLSPSVPLNLALIWGEIYPGLVCECHGSGRLEFEYNIFLKSKHNIYITHNCKPNNTPDFLFYFLVFGYTML